MYDHAIKVNIFTLQLRKKETKEFQPKERKPLVFDIDRTATAAGICPVFLPLSDPMFGILDPRSGGHTNLSTCQSDITKTSDHLSVYSN